jgi:dTDP-4-amino-4,6-dideoxygalactose transaminase
LFPVLVDGSREALAAHLRDRGVLSGEHYPVAIPDQPAMARAPHEIAGDLAKARRLAAHELSLPIHPFLDDAEVEQVIKAVNCWQA